MDSFSGGFDLFTLREMGLNEWGGQSSSLDGFMVKPHHLLDTAGDSLKHHDSLYSNCGVGRTLRQ